jgi:glycosyltransferase involved in cell wall biosynthesis
MTSNTRAPSKHQPASPPLVSVVIPHFNRPERLVETIQTVCDQTYSNWEVVVVDDASTISPERHLDRFAGLGVRLIVLPQNGGPSNARNVGIERATGDFVAFLDSDDAWAPQKLERQMAVALAAPNPDKVLVTTQVEKHTETTVSVSPSRSVNAEEGFAEYLFRKGGVVQTSSILLSRRTALEIGFDPALRQFEDYLFFLRCGAAGLTHSLVTEPLVRWFNDDRADRLSRSVGRNMTAANGFLAAAGDLMDEQSRLVFLTKHVGVLAIRENPLVGCSRLLLAISRGLVSPRGAAATAAHGLLPPPLLSTLRRRT